MGFFKHILCIFIVLFCAFNSYAQDKEYYILSSTIEFVVNTDNIIKNDHYNYYIDKIIPILEYNKDKVDNIILIGSASPEGNYENNIMLANKRADKIYSYIKDIIPSDKIVVNNDYALFLNKTGYDESDYRKLRATYIEIHFKKEKEIIKQIDTVYITNTIIDTVYCYNTLIDTVYITKVPEKIPILNIKTNLISDLLITPNVQAELYTYLWGISLEFDYTFPWYHKDYDKYFYYQILHGMAGIRKYLKNDYTGHYIGIYGNTGIYDICFFNKDLGWQGEAHGVGLSYGYVFRSKKYPRLKFEPYVRIGWLNTRFDTYHASDPWDEKYYYNWYSNIYDFVPRRFNMNYFGPTSIGFNLTFDLICIRKY